MPSILALASSAATFGFMGVKVEPWRSRCVRGAIYTHIFNVSLNIIDLNMCLFEHSKHFLFCCSTTSLEKECNKQVMKRTPVLKAEISVSIFNYLFKIALLGYVFTDRFEETCPGNISLILLCFRYVLYETHDQHVFIRALWTYSFFFEKHLLELTQLIQS